MGHQAQERVVRPRATAILEFYIWQVVKSGAVGGAALLPDRHEKAGRHRAGDAGGSEAAKADFSTGAEVLRLKVPVL